VLLGCDAITPTKIINKIGSELFCEVAASYKIPVYICTNSWKFDPKTLFDYDEEIETRSPKEVWEQPPKGVTIDNHAFENINPGLVKGIISELGVLSFKRFLKEVIRKYPHLKKYR